MRLIIERLVAGRCTHAQKQFIRSNGRISEHAGKLYLWPLFTAHD